MSTFDNFSIKAPNPTIPHIVLIGGFWRVSRAPRPIRVLGLEVVRNWNDAHEFVWHLNYVRALKAAQARSYEDHRT